ncbi:MAG: MFS transporter [Solirubrobacteraceae bacterium]
MAEADRRARGWGPRFEVLRLRDLRFVFGSTLASSLGDGIIGVALAFAVLDLTHSATDLGIVMAARTLTMIGGMLIGGVVADRLSRRMVMIAADLVRFAGQVAIGLLLLAGEATVSEVVVSQILVAAGNSFFEPASSGMIQAAAGEHVQEANALRVIASSSTGMLGPAIGGALVATIGSSYGLIADGASYLLSAVLLFQVSSSARAAHERDREASSFVADLRSGFDEVSGRRWVWATILNMAIANMLMAAYPVLGPLICKQHYGGAPAWALLSVVLAAGMLVGGSVLLRYRPRYLLRAGFLAFLPAMLPLVLLGLHAPIYLIAGCAFISGIGMTFDNALWWTAMQQHIPATAISRVSSYDWAGTLAVQPIGYALVGPLSDAIGTSDAIIACGAGATAVTISALLVRDIRTLETKPSGNTSDAPTEPAPA